MSVSHYYCSSSSTLMTLPLPGAAGFCFPKNCPCSKNYKQQRETYLQADEKQMLEASRKRPPGSL